MDLEVSEDIIVWILVIYGMEEAIPYTKSNVVDEIFIQLPHGDEHIKLIVDNFPNMEITVHQSLARIEVYGEYGG